MLFVYAAVAWVLWIFGKDIWDGHQWMRARKFIDRLPVTHDIHHDYPEGDE